MKKIHRRCAIFDHDLDELVCEGFTKLSTSKSGSEADSVNSFSASNKKRLHNQKETKKIQYCDSDTDYDSFYSMTDKKIA